MGLDDIWDNVLDSLGYAFSFEWISDGIEFLGGMFGNLEELSFVGIGTGLASAGLIYYLRGYMLIPFTKHMGAATAIFWTIVTYLGCFVMGYLVGKRIQEG